MIEIASCEEKIEDERSRLYGARVPMLSDMPRGGRPVTMDERIVRVVSREEELAKQRAEAERVKQIIERSIGAIQDPKDRTILKLKYLQGYSFEDLAETIHYSVSHTKTLHDQAVDNLEIHNT